MLPLRLGRLPQCEVVNIIFITRPKPSQMDIIADNVLKYETLNNNKAIIYEFIFLLQTKKKRKNRNIIFNQAKLSVLGFVIPFLLTSPF